MDISPLLKSQFLPIEEATFYRRDLNANSSDLSYHNHVLQGSYLRYIVHPLKNNEVPLYRYGLVAGTRRGVMREMKLSPSSEISVVQLATSDSSENRHALNVTGIDAVTSSRVTWQLVMPSDETEVEWKQALEAAKWSKENLESNNNNNSNNGGGGESEYELLREVTWRLSKSVPIKSRLHKFTVYKNCFLGVAAVRFFMQAFRLSSTQATVLGNKLMSAGMIEHVTHEHPFCDGRRFYRIVLDSSSPMGSTARVGGDADGEDGDVDGGAGPGAGSGRRRSNSRSAAAAHHHSVSAIEESATYLVALVTKYKRKYKQAQKQLSKVRSSQQIDRREADLRLVRAQRLGGTALQHQLLVGQMLLTTGAVAFALDYIAVAAGCFGIVCVLALYYDGCVVWLYSSDRNDSINPADATAAADAAAAAPAPLGALRAFGSNDSLGSLSNSEDDDGDNDLMTAAAVSEQLQQGVYQSDDLNDTDIDTDSDSDCDGDALDYFAEEEEDKHERRREGQTDRGNSGSVGLRYQYGAGNGGSGSGSGSGSPAYSPQQRQTQQQQQHQQAIGQSPPKNNNSNPVSTGLNMMRRVLNRPSAASAATAAAAPASPAAAGTNSASTSTARQRGSSVDAVATGLVVSDSAAPPLPAAPAAGPAGAGGGEERPTLRQRVGSFLIQHQSPKL